MKGLAMRLIVIFLIISVLTFLSLVSMGAIDEGTQGEGILGLVALLLSKLFYIFRFPTHTLFFQSFSSGHLFFVGLVINIIFWTTIIHLTTKYLKK
jgi:hypothetical protein